MTIFSKIVAGEISAHVVAETAEYLAFLDVSPLTAGHVLVIPKIEVPAGKMQFEVLEISR